MKKLQFFLVLLLVGFGAQAQTDSLLLSNNDLIVGEIKNMDKNIIGIETDYSDVDFKIKWDNVKRVYSKTNYLITLSDGRRYNGRIRSLNDSIVSIDTEMPEAVLSFSKKSNRVLQTDGGIVEVNRIEIVYLNALDDTFWSRLSLNFDVGMNLTKANDFRQYTFNTGMGYLADRWRINFAFNTLRSTQSEVDPIKRTELGFSYNYFLPKDWYLLYSLSILSNTEQLLDLRTSNMIGLGNYVVHTNRTYLGFSAGVNFNNEKFASEVSSSRSGEIFLGAQYNIFDIGDLDLLSTVVAYPSISEKGRFRTDFKFDIRYEFKFDLYFKVGTTMNYDNKPAEGASTLDYIFQTTIGWSL